MRGSNLCPTIITANYHQKSRVAMKTLKHTNINNTSLTALRTSRTPCNTTMPHCPQNQNQIADGVWKGFYSGGYGCSNQLS